MLLAANLPANRAVLFANLGQALNNGEKFPELFETSADISPSCYAKSLLALATVIREQPDQPLLQHIRDANLFFEWEIRLIRFGLATLRISDVFARLCDYYILIGAGTGGMARWAVGLWILLSCSSGFLFFAIAEDQFFGVGPLVLGFLTGISLLLSSCLLSPLMLKSWIVPDSRLWMAGTKIPLVRSLVVVRSVYQYLMNLGLCIQGGFDLDRALKITAKSEPVTWLRQRYQGVADDVAGGTKMSKAFLSSGILTETKILTAESGSKASGALWEAGITDVVRQAFVRQLTHVTRLILLGLLGLLGLVGLGLLYSLLV